MTDASYPWPQGRTSAVLISIDVDADTPLLWRHRSEPELRYLAEHDQRQHGLRRGLSAILEVLQRHAVAATFFVPGLVAARNPELLPRLVSAGHETVLHGYAHEAVRDTSDAEFSIALERSITLMNEQTGLVPCGFRAPGWEMTSHMLRELARRNLYDSSLAGDDVPYDIAGVTEVPVSWNREDTARFKLTGVADRVVPSSPVAVLEEWIFDWQATASRGGLFTLTLHDWIAGRPAQLRLLDSFLAAVRRETGCWITTARELAAHHRNCGGDGAATRGGTK